jgi:hypothetical integral membrane protein (TIGR02206 family)
LPTFERWGIQHVSALAVTALFALAVSALVRRSREEGFHRLVRGVMVALLAGALAASLLRDESAGALRWWMVLPLQLCDLAIFAAIAALVSMRPLAYELCYFWAGSGTLVAMLTPDLRGGWPSWAFLAFFALHGGVVAAAVILTLGFGLRPRRGAHWRAFAATNLYALVIGVVDAATGANFMYLRAKPMEASLLDHLGPWPLYILSGEAVALGLFALLASPFSCKRS